MTNDQTEEPGERFKRRVFFELAVPEQPIRLGEPIPEPILSDADLEAWLVGEGFTAFYPDEKPHYMFGPQEVHVVLHLLREAADGAVATAGGMAFKASLTRLRSVIARIRHKDPKADIVVETDFHGERRKYRLPTTEEFEEALTAIADDPTIRPSSEREWRGGGWVPPA
jgi:hypothetical protein